MAKEPHQILPPLLIDTVLDIDELKSLLNERAAETEVAPPDITETWGQALKLTLQIEDRVKLGIAYFDEAPPRPAPTEPDVVHSFEGPAPKRDTKLRCPVKDPKCPYYVP